MLIESAIVAGAASAIGYFFGRRDRRRTAELNQKPFCGCDHHLSMHDPETGHCHGTEKVTIYVDGDFDHDQWRACGCRRYVGPEPIGTVFTHPGVAFDVSVQRTTASSSNEEER